MGSENLYIQPRTQLSREEPSNQNSLQLYWSYLFIKAHGGIIEVHNRLRTCSPTWKAGEASQDNDLGTNTSLALWHREKPFTYFCPAGETPG